jgi:4-hydroxybutyrate dehydrogenase
MPEIQSFHTFAEFAEAHGIGEGDLIVTNKPLLPNYQKDVPEGTDIMCVEDYGKGEPTDVQFEAMQADMIDKNYKRIIALGGGSAIDISKALCAAEGRNLDELFDEKPENLRRTIKLYCIPTTCGTGSEVTVTAVFDRTRKGTKMGLTNYALGTDYAILIPELLKTLPEVVFGTSSIDALIHAVESYLDMAQATVGSRLFAERAIKMILKVYKALEREGLENRDKYLLEMQLASNFAGIAIANALPSASHAMGYPFAGKFHRPHGESCYVFLDVTLKKYLADVEAGKITEMQAEVWRSCMDIIAEAMEETGVSDAVLLDDLDKLLGVICAKKSLREYGATEQDCIDFGKNCYAQQQRLMSCAFTQFTEEELIEAFKAVY